MGDIVKKKYQRRTHSNFGWIVFISLLAPFITHGSSLTLNWTDNSENECGFLVERSADGVDYELIGETGIDETSMVVEGPPASDVYSYRVCAWNLVGRSGFTSITVANLSLASGNEKLRSATILDSYDPNGSGLSANLIKLAEVPEGYTIQWYLGITGDASIPIENATGSSLTPSGFTGTRSYWARLTSDSNSADVINSQSVTLISQPKNDEGSSDIEGLANISVRGRIDPVSRSMLLGLVITGEGSKRFLFRGIGPSIQGISSPVSDPKLTLRKLDQEFGFPSIASNDDWHFSNNSALLSFYMQEAGAYQLSEGSKDAALFVDLSPGIYALIYENVGESGKTFLLEAYDLDAILGRPTSARIANISSRNFIDEGEDVLIVGFVIEGAEEKELLIRASGLENAVGEDDNWIADPFINLTRNGIPTTSNDDWDENVEEIVSLSQLVGAFPLAVESGSSALSQVFDQGFYGGIISDELGESGKVLLELYDVPMEQAGI